MKKINVFILLLFLFTIALTACQSSEGVSSNNEKSPQIEETPSDETNEDQQKKEQIPSFVYPLTGVKTDNPVDHRAIGVMINNAPKARPHTGIHKADIVYEVLAEGWITRFLALFQSDIPDIVGSVRSARPYYVKLNNGYDALYVHHGWSSDGRRYIATSGTKNLNGLFYDGTLFTRVNFRSAPHNSYITYDHIMEGAEEKGYTMTNDTKPLPFLSQEEIEVLSGEKAGEITIDYLDRYRVKYVYDPETKAYERYSNGDQTIDRKTKTPVAVENILIVETPHHVLDGAGRREIHLTEGGDAWLLQSGTVQKISWKNDSGRILPVKNGEVVGFVPGQTWINVIPSDPGFAGAVNIVR